MDPWANIHRTKKLYEQKLSSHMKAESSICGSPGGWKSTPYFS